MTGKAAGALAALAAVFAAALPALAQGDPYPVESFFDWTQSPQRDAQDGEVGPYNFDAGIAGTARRAAQRWPDHYLDPDADAAAEAQVAYDSLLHNRPRLPYSHWGDVGHPAYMPDWDHDGVFGDSGGREPGGVGDFDADTDGVPDTAYFRIPCTTPDDGWRVHYEEVSGACDTADAGARYKLGVAHEVRVISARGLVLDATLWVPRDAFAGDGCPGLRDPRYGERDRWLGCVAAGNLGSKTFPGVVFSNGFSSRQEHYYWFAMRMVREGYVVLTYDPAGQGESEGTGGDTFGFSRNRADCDFAGACRDLQDVARWFVGRTIEAVPDDGFRIAPRKDPAGNAPNPVLGVLDVARIALAGNSMGAISTLSYLNYLGTAGKGADGEPLPPVVAAVSLSGATETRAIVPIQFQTSDYDGSPTLAGPAVLGVYLESEGEGIGYGPVKERYDLLRATTDRGPLSLVVLEGGVHTDHVTVPFVPRTLWSIALAGDYAADWINCHAAGKQRACQDAVSARPHLSRAFASEQDPDGPAGPSPSRCIRVPDKASLNQEPQDFVAASSGSPPYDCVA